MIAFETSWSVLRDALHLWLFIYKRVAHLLHLHTLVTIVWAFPYVSHTARQLSHRDLSNLVLERTLNHVLCRAVQSFILDKSIRPLPPGEKGFFNLRVRRLRSQCLYFQRFWAQLSFATP